MGRALEAPTDQLHSMSGPLRLRTPPGLAAEHLLDIGGDAITLHAFSLVTCAAFWRPSGPTSSRSAIPDGNATASATATAAATAAASDRDRAQSR